MSLTNFSKTFLKLFPVSKNLSFDFVGIDVCQDYIRVIKLKKTNIGEIPVKYKEYVLDKKCSLLSAEPSLDECGELIETLKKIKKDFGVDYVNVSIPEANTYVYRTTLPKSIGYEISKTLEFSIEENVPINPNDALLDYFVLSETDDEVVVIVTVVAKSIIEKFSEVIESADLKPISFEPENHAIARGIIKNGNTNQYIILNLDKCASSIVIVEQGIVQYTQTILVSNDFSLKFDENEAKTLKENINKIIIYWTTSVNQVGKGEIKNMFLVGENAYSQELLNFLEKNVSLNVKFADVWVNCFDLNSFIPDIHIKDSLKYASAIGLALKKIK